MPTVTPRRGALARHPLGAFFGLAFAGAWLPLVPIVLSQGEHGLGILPVVLPDPLLLPLALLATFAGPLVAALVVTAAVDGRAGLRRLGGSMVRWRVGARWYLVAVFAPLTIWLATYSLALTGSPLAALAQQWTLLFTLFFPLVAVGIIFPSVGEEPGWRGFALPRLQARHGPVIGSLILGALHGLWHLPSFFTPFAGPFVPQHFAAFVLTAMFATFLYTWLFNRTGGSVLLAMIMHGASNAASALMSALVVGLVPEVGWMHALEDGGWLNALAFGAAALVLVVATRGRLGAASPGSLGHTPLPSPTPSTQHPAPTDRSSGVRLAS